MCISGLWLLLVAPWDWGGFLQRTHWKQAWMLVRAQASYPGHGTDQSNVSDQMNLKGRQHANAKQVCINAEDADSTWDQAQYSSSSQCELHLVGARRMDYLDASLESIKLFWSQKRSPNASTRKRKKNLIPTAALMALENSWCFCGVRASRVKTND